MPLTAIRNFLRMEASGGILLMIAAALALIVANSPVASYYTAFFETHLIIGFGDYSLDKTLIHWVNDGLMAVFFLLVGLEIKREVVQGELSSPSKAALPLIAAIGGMVMPALVYLVFNFTDPVTSRGWAIPAATDIAFALGILMLLGSRAPLSMKIFLTALAIIDDLGAIIIIALFYTEDLSLVALYAGLGCVAVLITLNVAGVRKVAPYVLVGIILWVCVLKSGVHATLAGVALALAIPLGERGKDHKDLAGHLEHELHPWVAYAILPLFAFANAGVSLQGLTPAALLAPVPLGIALGLFVGKQIGVMGFLWLGKALRLCKLPEDVTWSHIYGVALLTGIGFTMSLFIGTLAFEHTPDYADDVRLGVLGGSILSGLAGYVVLRFVAPKARDVGATPLTAES
ncbi:Na+/H+ antiporter NhaA [Roseospira marina]|uniref:Na(+)/H(+) antiporter NhaA n=1 Tax=Roseospira marina TaxID=140057 RepID=A0A5M6IBX6_9PROT|nr:Na+/H+ antiporter NhaA [Roseospira marina]KAA5605622.1 Na+/H+ antiporter NhaA [Roseospira marina]MBB4313307.1 NhaA family Na+:H+ antiporter [Roseospira marina]MBB5085952.1 NhaA family Na+:H+ antiporter [Roseospira marina]